MAKNVLIIDDDHDDQQIFCEAIHNADRNLTCDTADNGIQGLMQLQSKSAYDMVFLDINMPFMNGFECLKHIKQIKKYEDVPVIIMSTSSSEKDYQESIKLGAYSFITKPNDFNVFQKIIKSIVTTIKN